VHKVEEVVETIQEEASMVEEEEIKVVDMEVEVDIIGGFVLLVINMTTLVLNSP
jgi:hypothetical protein